MYIKTALLELNLCSVSQLFTEYGRLAMEEVYLKPFQVWFMIFEYINPFNSSTTTSLPEVS